MSRDNRPRSLTIYRRWAAGAMFFHAAIAGAVSTGPEVGKSVPDFRLRDQSGVERTLRSVLGPKGALLVFYRSADW